jgi:hypothetical protein
MEEGTAIQMTTPTQLGEMTDEELNVRLAELCGWSAIEDFSNGLMMAPGTFMRGYPPKGAIIGKKEDVPRYCSDANAVAAAYNQSRWAEGTSQFFFYEHQKNLWRVVTGRDEINKDIDYMHSLSMEEVIHAKPRQRTIALILTLTP